MIPPIQIPDFAGTISRGLENRSRLADLASQNAVSEALSGGGAEALFGSDAAARSGVLARLAGLGQRGLHTAMPFWQMEQQRMRPAGEGEIPGLRPGTVALVNGAGNVQVIQSPDTMSAESEAQRIRIANASRAPSQPRVTWTDVTDPNTGEITGQRSSTGQFQPINSPGLSPANANMVLARMADGYAAGTLTPAQESIFEAAAAVASQPRSYFDQQTGQMVTVAGQLPPRAAAAIAGRRGAQPAAPSAEPPAAAPAAPADGVPIPGTGLSAAPPDNSGVTVRQVAPGRAPEPSGEERISSGYASRMLAAEQLLGQTVRQGYQPGNVRDALANRAGTVGNFVMSDQGQLYRQAQEDWVRAKLRRESGAVIGEEEMAREIRVYFPQPGDSPEVIAQKEQARRIAAEAMVGAAGRSPVTRPAAPASRPAPPQPGQVMDGYRFRGGNPADRNSWERVP